MQEPEQERCGTTHYAGCACHEQGWENKWKSAIEMAAQASVERDEYRRIAGELVAAIRINTMRGTFATATIEDVDRWLKQWTDKFARSQHSVPRTKQAHPWAQLKPTMNEKLESKAPSDAAACSGWIGKLTHDRSGYSDWGWLRDEAGDLIVIVKIPPLTDDEISQHRRAGTDPAQARVDVILAAINGQNAADETRRE